MQTNQRSYTNIIKQSKNWKSADSNLAIFTSPVFMFSAQLRSAANLLQGQGHSKPMEMGAWGRCNHRRENGWVDNKIYGWVVCNWPVAIFIMVKFIFRSSHWMKRTVYKPIRKILGDGACDICLQLFDLWELCQVKNCSFSQVHIWAVGAFLQHRFPKGPGKAESFGQLKLLPMLKLTSPSLIWFVCDLPNGHTILDA